MVDDTRGKEAIKDSSEKLPLGILQSVGETVFEDPVSYLEEVASFRDAVAQGKEKSPFPFVNQQQAFRQVVSHLAQSSYPFVVLIGEPGIGKTMIVDHLLAAIQGKGSLEELVGDSHSLQQEIQALRDKARRFEHRDYLLLPNLRQPRHVQALAYTAGEIERETAVAEEFCQSMVTVLNHYANDYKKNIRYLFSEQEFKKYARAKINEFYLDLYGKVEEILDENDDVALITVIPEEKSPGAKIHPFTASWKFLNAGVKINKYKARAGLQKNAKAGDRTQIEKMLAINFVPRRAVFGLESLLEELSRTVIEGKDEKAVQALVFEEFASYNAEVLAPLGEKYQGKSFSQAGLIAELRQGAHYRNSPKISHETLDDIEMKIQGIRDRFTSGDCSQQLLQWMDSVVAYFKEERKQVEKNILEMLREKAHEEEMRARLKDERGKSDEEREKAELEMEYLGNFRLQHGDHRMPIDRIFQVNAFKDLSALKAVNSMVVREFSSDTLFGTFKDHTVETPPHMTLTNLGTYFQGGILVFPDDFSGFVAALRESTKSGDAKHATGSMRERFLEALQRGTIAITRYGTTFTFEAPRMILGCDNKDPFFYMDGFLPQYDEALRDRIQCIGVPAYAENTIDARKGSLRILLRTVEEYNEKGRKKQGGESGVRGSEVVDSGSGVVSSAWKDVSLQAEVMDNLLRKTISAGAILSLRYRQQIQELEEVLSFASRRGDAEISLQTLKEMAGEKASPLRFFFIDADAQDDQGYFNLPKRQAGFLNGLAVTGVATAQEPVIMGVRFGISSYLVQRREKLSSEQERFTLIDSQEGMTIPITDKGYLLARDYVLNTIHALRAQGLSDKEGWQVRTEFYGNKGMVGGDSASLAIALSILSALAGDELYRNRFFTGTLQPQEGTVGPIGGLVYKAQVPLRLRMKAETGNKEQGIEAVRGKQNAEGGEIEDFYLLFPSANRRDFVEEVMTDPFGVEQKITSIPLQTFEEAYFLATCGASITVDDVKYIKERSGEVFAQAKEKIKQRLEWIDVVVRG